MIYESDNEIFLAVLTVLSLIVLSLVSSPAMNFSVASTPWPMFHGNPRHTGLSPFDGPVVSSLRWKFTTGAGVYSSPVVAFGKIYVGSDDGNLYALNRDGKLEWKFATGGPIRSAPAVSSQGVVYVGSLPGGLFAINQDGSFRWKFPSSGCPTACVDFVSGAPTVGSDGTIYITMGVNDFFKLWAINPDGFVKWSVQLSAESYDSPAIAPDGTIYVGVDDPPGQTGFCEPGLCAVNANGTIMWSSSIGLVFSSSPVVGSDGTVYVTGGRLYGFSAIRSDGTVRWNRTGIASADATASIGPMGTIYSESGDYLYSLASNGNILWKFPLVSNSFNVGPTSSPAIDENGSIFVGSSDGNFYALNPDGTILWKIGLGGMIESSPAIDLTGTIYVGSSDGNLYAIGNAN